MLALAEADAPARAQVGERWKGLTAKQEEAYALLRGPQTHTCLVGGSRSGKTFLIVRAIIVRASKAPGSRHLMTRYRTNAVRSSVRLDTYRKVLRLCCPGTYSHSSEGYEELPNGSQIWFGGLDEAERVEKILGMEFATIYAGECSQIPYSSVLVLRTRLAQSNTGLKLRGFYDLNPTSTDHWTNMEFGEKRDPISRKPLLHPDQYQRMFLNPHDNAENLDPEYLRSLDELPDTYRLRFRDGVYTIEIEGALWTMDLLEMCRDEEIDPDPRGKKLGEFQRVVIGVDPSGAQSKHDVKSDEIGIVVCGRKHDKSAVVLEDATLRGSPLEWGRRVAAMWRRWRADCVIAEVNFGGAMVESTIKAADSSIKVALVPASRGKIVRAEPIAALYEQKRVRHAGAFPELESQLCKFSNLGYKGDRSPDRADACVWALTDLLIESTSTYTLANIR